jgi:hypothetical protein
MASSSKGATLLTSRLKYLYLAYLSRPVGDRAIYRTIRRRNVRKILEIGIGTAGRALRMIDLARRGAPGETVRYVAIDMFEGRASSDAPGLSIKEAHRLLKATTAQVQLIPGDPRTLARAANALQNQDLVIISAEHDDAALAGAWFYLPRMLHADSVVYRETRVAETLVPALLAPSEIEFLASANRRPRAA